MNRGSFFVFPLPPKLTVALCGLCLVVAFAGIASAAPDHAVATKIASRALNKANYATTEQLGRKLGTNDALRHASEYSTGSFRKFLPANRKLSTAALRGVTLVLGDFFNDESATRVLAELNNPASLALASLDYRKYYYRKIDELASTLSATQTETLQSILQEEPFDIHSPAILGRVAEFAQYGAAVNAIAPLYVSKKKRTESFSSLRASYAKGSLAFQIALNLLVEEKRINQQMLKKERAPLSDKNSPVALLGVVMTSGWAAAIDAAGIRVVWPVLFSICLVALLLRKKLAGL